MVTVYTRENCQPCKMTKRELDKLGIAFEEVSISENPDVAAELVAEGFLAAPVVKTTTDAWSGFAPTKIRGIAAAV